jgi:HK97 family phage major capsid protein
MDRHLSAWRAAAEAPDATPAALRPYETHYERLRAESRMAEAADEVAELHRPEPRVTRPWDDAGVPVAGAITGGTLASARDPRWGFRSKSEWFNALRRSANPAVRDERLMNAVTTYGQEGIGPDGGFAIPPEWASESMRVVEGEESLLPRFNPIPVASNQLVVPTDEGSGWAASGIYAEWIGEGAAATVRKPALKQLRVRIDKLVALVALTDEVLEDSPATAPYVFSKLAEALAAKVNEALMTGDGVTEPLGVLRAPALVSVAGEASGNGAGTLVVMNALKLVSRLYASSYGRSFWIGHSSILPALWSFTQGQAPVYLPDMKASPWGTLLGRPLVLSEYAANIGTVGDLTLVDPRGMVVAVHRQSPQTAASIHFGFDQGIQAFRATMRMGSAGLAAAATPRKSGSLTQSHLVTVATRT